MNRFRAWLRYAFRDPWDQFDPEAVSLWPDECRAASADRNPKGEDPQGLRAKHESAVRDSGDAQ